MKWECILKAVWLLRPASGVDTAMSRSRLWSDLFFELDGENTMETPNGAPRTLALMLAI